MDSMEAYLSRLKMAFEEEDFEDYDELKEDLLEQLTVCLEEGQTEAEVVARLAPPEEIAADYYADRSLNTAMNAKTYVIPKEDVQNVFIESQKKRIKKAGHVAAKISKPLFLLLLISLFIFFIIYLSKELIEDKHIAAIPLSVNFILSALFVHFIGNWLKGNKRLVRSLSFSLIVLGLGSFLYFTVTNQLFYTGRNYFNEIELSDGDGVKFNFHSNADVDITTVEVASSEKLSFMVKGQFKESDIKKIEAGNYEKKVDLALDQENVFDLFTKTGRSQIIFFIPKGVVLEDFNLDLTQGDLRIVDLDTKNFDLNMQTGDLYAKNIVADKGTISNDFGDIVLEESSLDLTINSISGKTVITGFLGNLSIDVESGLSILKKLDSEKATINNHSSRMVLEDSAIRELNTNGESGQLIVKHTSGNLSIRNQEGKIVSEENKGNLILENISGPTIVIQSTPIDAEVSSDSGFIKWLQDPTAPMQISTSTQTGDLRNEFSEISDAKEKAFIRSNSGDVKALKKVE